MPQGLGLGMHTLGLGMHTWHTHIMIVAHRKIIVMVIMVILVMAVAFQDCFVSTSWLPRCERAFLLR